MKRCIIIIILLFLSVILISINFRLYSENYTKDQHKDDVIKQLVFLESELKTNRLAERMQLIFPEGYIFVNALYGLSWCELALSFPDDDVLKKRALKEAVYAFDNLNTETAKWIFPRKLNPEYGIFYNGWKNYLLSKILNLNIDFEGKEYYVSVFENQSDLIANALVESSVPFLESYTGQAWPADMTLAIASLANYDKIFVPRYKRIIEQWICDIREKLDPQTGIIPHKVDSKTAKTIQGARGCSIGLILRILGEIDKDFASEQFSLAKTNFITTTFGLPSMREYPRGELGFGDIDSGPVIFGVGFSGTIVMIGTLSMYGYQDLAMQQYKTVHAFGFARQNELQKFYLFGQLPMADAFIAWGRATALKYSKNDLPFELGFWLLKFHLISFLLLLLLWGLFYRKKILRRIKS